MLVLVATMIRVAGLTTDGEVVRSCEIKRTASLWVSLLPRENSCKCASVAVMVGMQVDIHWCF